MNNLTLGEETETGTSPLPGFPLVPRSSYAGAPDPSLPTPDFKPDSIGISAAFRRFDISTFRRFSPFHPDLPLPIPMESGLVESGPSSGPASHLYPRSSVFICGEGEQRSAVSSQRSIPSFPLRGPPCFNLFQTISVHLCPSVASSPLRPLPWIFSFFDVSLRTASWARASLAGRPSMEERFLQCEVQSFKPDTQLTRAASLARAN